MAIVSPEGGDMVAPTESVLVVVEYAAASVGDVPIASIAAVELLLDGDSIGVIQLGLTQKKSGSVTFNAAPESLPPIGSVATFKARAYSIYHTTSILSKWNKVAAESAPVTIQVGSFEAPAVVLAKQAEGFALSLTDTYASVNYAVQRKIDDGSFAELTSGLGIDSYADSDLGTLGIYTYKVIATNSKGESKESNEVHAYVSELGNGLLAIDETGADSDGDGLTDFLETNKYLTDVTNPDTDGDGLKDGDEAFKSFTDPSKPDTDGNGVSDSQEDLDGDRIVNGDEITHHTDPLLEDTDLDQLSDYEEVFTYGTDPVKEDTDGDGLSDGNEIAQDTDPLVPDTDGDGMSDGDEVFTVTREADALEKDTAIEPSVVLDVVGKHLDGIAISNVGEANPYLPKDIPGYIGAPYDFSAPEFTGNATIRFKLDPALLDDPDFKPAIYYFNELTRLLELLPNQTIDPATGTVSAETDHFSTYLILNKKLADAFWAKEMKPPFEGEIENIELVIGFAIDSSGSMSSNDPTGLRKQTAKEFVDQMDENDKAAVIDFDSTAKVLAPLTDDKTAIKNAIDRIDSSGNTNLGAGVKAALAQLQSSNSPAKYIIMLTDGVGSYDPALTQQAINQGVKIYTIGLGSGVDVRLLQSIAEATGGKYYHASTASDLTGIFEQTTEETIDLTTDTDSDGLSDYHEKRGVRVNAYWIFTEFDNPDTDGDGLKDGEEITYKDEYFDMHSDPNKKDSDNDGIDDNIDPEPIYYNITDRTLALAAGLSYKNLKSNIGDWVGINGEREISGFRIVGANDSGYTTLNDFFDAGLGSVAIKISRYRKKDAVIFAIRGTQGFDEDLTFDKLTDLFLGIGLNTKQSKAAFDEYKKLAKNYPNADLYITGHSLGGRLTQDVLYKIYDANDGTLGLFKDDMLTPVHSATFNALGYNKAQFFNKSLLSGGIVDNISLKLKNYYYERDFVGDGLGNSVLFERLGTDIGPWVAKDPQGVEIDGLKFPGLNLIISAVHGISLWHQESRLINTHVSGVSGSW